MVREFILNGLKRGDISPGEKLPPERELAERLGTSRATVRQALMILESELQVTRHVGRGTFVAKTAALQGGPAQWVGSHVDGTAAMGMVTPSPNELMETRHIIEPQIAGLVVINATEADLRSIREIAEAQQALPDDETFEESDMLFHQALARAAHNDLVIAIADLIICARNNPEWRKLKKSVHTHNTGRRADAIAEHLDIVDALESRNAARARDTMRFHLEAVRRNLLGN